MTVSDSKGISLTFFVGIVERFLKKYPFPSTENRKSVITKGRRVNFGAFQNGRKGGNGAYGKITGAYRHPAGDQHCCEKPPSPQADADREGSGKPNERRKKAAAQGKEREYIILSLMRKKSFFLNLQGHFRGRKYGRKQRKKRRPTAAMACEQGFLTVAPHLLFPQFLN